MKPIYEIFEILEKTRNKKSRIKVLQENKSEQLLEILDHAYNDNFEFVVDIPTFKVTEDLEGNTKFRLYNYTKQLQALTNKLPNFNKKDRDDIILNILSTVHPKDVEIVRSIVEFRKIPYDKIDKELVLEAFPEMKYLWG